MVIENLGSTQVDSQNASESLPSVELPPPGQLPLQNDREFVAHI